MVEEQNDKISYLFQIAFSIKKDVDVGEIEKMLRGLGTSFEMITFHKDRVILKKE
jgi:hypothetical protein